VAGGDRGLVAEWETELDDVCSGAGVLTGIGLADVEASPSRPWWSGIAMAASNSNCGVCGCEGGPCLLPG
jgi:hypothetical protein